MTVTCKDDGKKFTYGLTPGKKYFVLYYSERIEEPLTYNKIKKGEYIFIPVDALFYIQVLNDNNEEHFYWNDYFISTNELRELKLKRILEE